MGFRMLFGCLKSIKELMTKEEIKLWCQNKGYITFERYKSGYPNYNEPTGFIEEKVSNKTR